MVKSDDAAGISKGVDCYAYLGPDGFSSRFSKPCDFGTSTATVSLDAVGSMQHTNLQIYEHDIGAFSHTGRFEWTLSHQGTAIVSQYADISPLTGDLDASTLGDMLATPSVFGLGWAVSYGFYDSGSGVDGLTNQDQAYVYATPDMSNWMGDLATAMDGVIDSQAFSLFVLPGAHDCGMFDPTCIEKILDDFRFMDALAGAIDGGGEDGGSGGGGEVALGPVKEAILRTVINLAFTQKDTITSMLNLGVRYFDFRPGHCYEQITAGLYHQHNFIPGYPYDAFLQDVLNWMLNHPSEIVVISPNAQGFPHHQPAMKPSWNELQACLDSAFRMTGAGGQIVVGSKKDLHRTYAELLEQNKRLILLPQIDDCPFFASKYDSYQPDAYTTTDVATIVAALDGMQSPIPAGDAYTVLQLQGTATGTRGGILTSVLTFSDASSPLMSTKPRFDSVTYAWALENVANRFPTPGLVVLLNDFCDNALASVASQITAARMGGLKT